MSVTKRGWLQLHENGKSGPLLWVVQTENYLSIYQSNAEFKCPDGTARTIDLPPKGTTGGTFGFEIHRSKGLGPPVVVARVVLDEAQERGSMVFVGDQILEINGKNVSTSSPSKVQSLLDKVSGTLQLKVRNSLAMRARHAEAPKNMARMRRLAEVPLANARIALEDIPLAPGSTGCFSVGASDGVFECTLVCYTERDADSWVSCLRQGVWRVTIRKGVWAESDFVMSPTEMRKSMPALDDRSDEQLDDAAQAVAALLHSRPLSSTPRKESVGSRKSTSGVAVNVGGNDDRGMNPGRRLSLGGFADEDTGFIALGKSKSDIRRMSSSTSNLSEQTPAPLNVIGMRLSALPTSIEEIAASSSSSTTTTTATATPTTTTTTKAATTLNHAVTETPPAASSAVTTAAVITTSPPTTKRRVAANLVSGATASATSSPSQKSGKAVVVSPETARLASATVTDVGASSPSHTVTRRPSDSSASIVSSTLSAVQPPLKEEVSAPTTTATAIPDTAATPTATGDVARKSPITSLRTDPLAAPVAATPPRSPLASPAALNNIISLPRSPGTPRSRRIVAPPPTAFADDGTPRTPLTPIIVPPAVFADSSSPPAQQNQTSSLSISAVASSSTTATPLSGTTTPPILVPQIVVKPAVSTVTATASSEVILSPSTPVTPTLPSSATTPKPQVPPISPPVVVATATTGSSPATPAEVTTKVETETVGVAPCALSTKKENATVSPSSSPSKKKRLSQDAAASTLSEADLAAFRAKVQATRERLTETTTERSASFHRDVAAFRERLAAKEKRDRAEHAEQRAIYQKRMEELERGLSGQKRQTMEHLSRYRTLVSQHEAQRAKSFCDEVAFYRRVVAGDDWEEVNDASDVGDSDAANRAEALDALKDGSIRKMGGGSTRQSLSHVDETPEVDAALATTPDVTLTSTDADDGSTSTEKSRSTLQRRRSHRRKASSEGATIESRRRHIMNEILSSERSYLDTLNTIKTVFFLPLCELSMSPKPIIAPQDFDTIFYGLEDIIEINSLLLERLNKRMPNAWNPSLTFGDIFLSVMDKLRIYTRFVNNFPRTMAKIEECSHQSSQFREFLKDARKKPECKMLGLRELLLSPIQRIPRYQLLLGELSQNTEPSDADYFELAQAFMSMRSLAQHLNEAKREAEHQQEVEIVAATIKDCPRILQPTRHFICEGTFSEMNVKSGGATRISSSGFGDLLGRVKQEVMFFLFSDILIVARKSRSKKGYKAIYESLFPLSLLQFEDLSKVNTPSSELLFQLIHHPSYNKVFKCASPALKQDFLTIALRTQKEHAVESSYNSFV